MSPLVQNEQTKLLARAVNNMGVASFVTGVIGPIAGFLLGSLQVDDPLRLACFVMIWIVVGGMLLLGARRLLGRLV